VSLPPPSVALIMLAVSRDWTKRLLGASGTGWSATRG
jgi:hypothetical protein